MSTDGQVFHECSPEAPCVNTRDSFTSSLTSPTNVGVDPSVVGVVTTDDNSNFPRFIVATSASLRSHKTSPIWNFFSNFDPVFHPDKKHHRICLVCRDLQIDTSISVGRDYSNTPLVAHLRTKHKVQYKEYLAAKDGNGSAKSKSKQSTVSSHFSTVGDVQERFKRKFARWVVEDSLPLTICRSSGLKSMIKTANKTLTLPNYETLLDFLHTTKLGAVGKMKVFFRAKHFACTIDHWTSFAQDNYGAITLHLIDDFKLKSFVLSCVKHENGCSGAEMERQLSSDLTSWELDKSFFISLVTDTASNMNQLGERVCRWRDATQLRHHYCSDHVLQRTAVMAFSGNLVDHALNADVSVSAVRKAKDLVTFVKSSPIATEKIRHAQVSLGSQSILKLISDVETRWWSTHTLIERVLKLRDALNFVFDAEFRFRDSPNQLTSLEKLRLTDSDYDALTDILSLLTPFKEAQLALEGETYVNLSLLPLVIYHLDQKLQVYEGAADPLVQGALLDLMSRMIVDFKNRWGDRVTYSSHCVRGDRRRQVGVPTYAFWAMVLDPRTKKMISKVLSPDEVFALWQDVTDEIIRIATENFEGNNNQNPVPVVAQPVRVADEDNIRNPNVGPGFLRDFQDDAAEPLNAEIPAEILANSVRCEVEKYKVAPGCPLYSNDNHYSCPLQWWSIHVSEYPHVWDMAKRYLCIPATSAPAERVFSSAANLVNKKRILLNPDTVDLLIYLRGNSTFVDWGDE
jgi:hypothetical protein